MDTNTNARALVEVESYGRDTVVKIRPLHNHDVSGAEKLLAKSVIQTLVSPDTRFLRITDAKNTKMRIKAAKARDEAREREKS